MNNEEQKPGYVHVICSEKDLEKEINRLHKDGYRIVGNHNYIKTEKMYNYISVIMELEDGPIVEPVNINGVVLAKHEIKYALDYYFVNGQRTLIDDVIPQINRAFEMLMEFIDQQKKK